MKKQRCSKNIPSLAEGLLLLFCVGCATAIAYKMRGIYPFGSLTIEGDDGYNQHLPLYFYIWDVLHGKKSILFDWNIALGSPLSGAALHFGLYSPLHFIYLFLPRTAVPYSVCFLAAIRLALCAFAFRFMLRHSFSHSLSPLWVIFLSCMYAINSWTMHYLYFFQWLDAAILLPMVISGLEDLLSENTKGLRYTLCLALFLIINAQMDSAMMIFLILFSVCLMLGNSKNKVERNAAIFRLGMYTVIALLLASVILLPAALQISDSARMQENLSYTIKQIYLSNASPDHTYDKEKRIILQSIPAYSGMIMITLLGCLWKKKHPKAIASLVGILAILLLLMLPIESIHYFWQGGSYLCFPLRAGFVLFFTSLYFFGFLLHEGGFQVNAGWSVIVILCAGLLLGYLSGKRLGLTDNREGVYQSEQELYDLLHENSKPEERFLDKSDKLTPNYSLVASIPAAANWIHIIPWSIMDEARYFGYFRSGSNISGSGGTHFSDALLGVKYVVYPRGENVDSDLYTLFANTDDLTIYQYNLKLPFVGMMIYGNDPEEINWNEQESFLKFQNQVSEAMYGKSLFCLYPLENNSELRLHFSEKTLIYADNPSLNGLTLTINGQQMQAGKERIQYLGIYQDDVVISCDSPLQIGSCSLSELISLNPEEVASRLTFGKTTMNCDICADNQGTLFLPLHAAKGLHCTLDGRTAKITPLFGGYIGVKIPAAGNYHLELRYRTPGLLLGLCLTIIGTVLLLWNLKGAFINKLAYSRLAKHIQIIYWMLVIGVLFAIYLCNLIFMVLPDDWWMPLLSRRILG